MKLFFFQILVFYTEVTFHLVPDADQIAPALKVSHFYCSSMTENSLYATNQVRPCHITPEELEVGKATITLYTKHFRKDKANAASSIYVKNGTVDILTIAALTTILPERPAI